MIMYINDYICVSHVCFSSVQFSRSVVSKSLQLHGLQHTRPPCPSATPGDSLTLMSIESVMPSNHLIYICMCVCVCVCVCVYIYMQLGASQVALVAMNPLANAGDIRDTGSIPGSGRSLEEGHGNPLQFSCRENPVDRGAWQATVHGVAELDTYWSHACLAHNDHRVLVPCFGFACLCNDIFFFLRSSLYGKRSSSQALKNKPSMESTSSKSS